MKLSRLNICSCGNPILSDNQYACCEQCELETHGDTEGVIPNDLYDMLFDIDAAEEDDNDGDFTDYFTELRENLHDN